MLRNYFKTALRNFLKRKVNTLVTVAGLAVSLAFCMLMYIYVDGALRWDKMHPDSGNTYLIAADNYSEDNVPESFGLFDFSQKPVYRSSAISYVHGQDLRANIPEIQQSTLVYHINRSSDIQIGDGQIFQESITSADGDFFNLFSFEVLSGTPEQALVDPKSLTLSEAFALRHFKTVDVVNERISIFFNGQQEVFKVVGVVRIPEKSSVTFSVLSAIESNKNIGESILTLQSNTRFNFFVNVSPQTDPDIFEDKIDQYFNDTFSNHIESKRNFVDISSESPILRLRAINLRDIHLDGLLDWHNKANIQHIALVGIFAITLLLISGINYLLISLATLSSRASEISMRIINGARKVDVRLQFWIETVLMAGFSLLVSICLLQFSIPFVENQTGVEIQNSTLILSKAAGFIFLCLAALGFLISTYPGNIISSLSLADTVKGNIAYKLKTGLINWLVGFQFTLCFIFIAGGLVMNSQMNFVLKNDLGFDKEQVVRIKGGNTTFKETLSSYPEFEQVARGGAWLFGNGAMGFVHQIKGEKRLMVHLESERDMIELLDLNIEWLDQDYGDGQAALVNESLADLIGRENLAETRDVYRLRVVGIVKNAQILPLNAEEEFFFINLNSRESRLWETYVKIKPGLLSEGLERLHAVWNATYPNQFLDYEFLDDYIAKNYASYRTTTNLINFITLLGVVISCLGLFALNGIIISNRMKEIGIRKVLGASVKHIMLLVNSRVLTILFLACLIAIPIAYYLTTQWLEEFSKHVTVDWTFFGWTIVTGALLAIVTISLHTVKSAFVNPVHLLKED